jgi:Zn-dependent protease with chaperone function
MSFGVRIVVLTLASFGVAALATAVVVALIWRTPDGVAAQRAARLWRMRLLPAGIAVAAGLFAIIGLWRFESRQDHEQIGWVVQLSGVFGGMFLVAIAGRLLKMHLATRRLLATWLGNATRFSCPEVPGLPHLSLPAYRIDTRFPVVAVIGVFRPILVVDATVLDSCSPDELSAILAHEHGHLRRWDNLRRAAFAATPDLLAWTPVGPALREAWRQATEEAADDVAAQSSQDAGVNLADALIHVARIAQGTDAHSTAHIQVSQLPACALYRGENIERRVRRLLAPPQTGTPGRRRWGAVLAAAAVATAFGLQRQIHDLMEVAVKGLW